MIHNLTPYAIEVVNSELPAIFPSEMTAGIRQEFRPDKYHPQIDGYPIYTHASQGEVLVNNMFPIPEQADGIWYIVLPQIGEALPYRKDLLVPINFSIGSTFLYCEGFKIANAPAIRLSESREFIG